MRTAQHIVDRSNQNNTLLRENRYPVAGRIKRVEIMGDEKNRQAERFLQIVYQIVERGRADRIETGGRLVQKEYLRIERKGPRPARLRMPPESSEG